MADLAFSADTNSGTSPSSLNRRLTLSPRELADAVGVSESSVKRWIDAGEIDAARTTGGHRRIAHREAVRFARERGLPIAEPRALEALGIGGAKDMLADGLSADTLEALLLAGDADRARDLLVAEYVRGASLPALCDGPIRETLQRFGVRWEDETEGIGAEHEATAMFIHALGQIRTLGPKPSPSAPVALGGAAPKDPYIIPTLMAAAVLEDCGFRVTNYGPNTPLVVLRSAAKTKRAALVWLSISTPDAAETVRTDSELDLFRATEGRVIIGGREASEAGLEGVTVLESMDELADVARTLLDGAAHS